MFMNILMDKKFIMTIQYMVYG